MSKKRIGSLVVTILALATFVVAALNVQYLQDMVRYHQYEPTDVVASFASDAGMSERGRFLFYTSQPMLSDASVFNQQCEKRETTTAILGCYDGQNIYIYDVPDERLDGIRPTTAAHEMLHAAYQRLGNDDRRRVDALLEAEYNTLKDDEDLVDRMDFYARTQPGDRANELHSIIGTEVDTISAELEEHYSQYFTDRSKVVAQHGKYHSVFMSLRKRADTLNKQIDKLEVDINKKRAAYTAESSVINGAIDDFNRRANNGEFATQAAFHQERQALVARVASIENLRTDINVAINKYNALITELDDIATETETLNHSLDSNLAPAPSL